MTFGQRSEPWVTWRNRSWKGQRNECVWCFSEYPGSQIWEERIVAEKALDDIERYREGGRAL